MIYIGLDVHKVNTTVAWLDRETGEISEAHNCPTDQLAERLATLRGSKRVVMETGASSSFLARQLKSCGLEVMVVDAYKSHRLGEARQTAKTDKLDAQSLAWLLAAGLLETAAVWLPDQETEQLRELERTRQRLTQQTTRLRNAVRACLVRHGQDCPYSDLLGKEATQWLDECQAQLPALVQISGQALRNSLAAIVEQVKVLATEVSQQSENNQQAALLRTIPGVGPLLSVAIVAEIGDIRRFPSAAHLRSYSGLVPRVHQSGSRRTTGPLTKRGNRFLRWAMVLAAQHFSRVTATKNLSLRKWYYHLAFQHGPNVAKVALARRMLGIIFAMLRDGAEFDPTRLTGADTQS